ncbi:uncharacterized protein [Equus przewalskii]|uniref:Uncharacterized protein n=1 Tax=Equus przewalskii TaxID=9798 RepID=A0ABM4MW56_EQUPR
MSPGVSLLVQSCCPGALSPRGPGHSEARQCRLVVRSGLGRTGAAVCNGTSFTDPSFLAQPSKLLQLQNLTFLGESEAINTGDLLLTCERSPITDEQSGVMVTISCLLNRVAQSLGQWREEQLQSQGMFPEHGSRSQKPAERKLLQRPLRPGSEGAIQEEWTKTEGPATAAVRPSAIDTSLRSSSSDSVGAAANSERVKSKVARRFLNHTTDPVSSVAVVLCNWHLSVYATPRIPDNVIFSLLTFSRVRKREREK